MVDRNPGDTASGNDSPKNDRPGNVGAGPGTGNPRPDYPGGAPVDVRDGTLRRHPPMDDRAGPATRSGWSGGGMAIPALFVVAAILALIALLL